MNNLKTKDEFQVGKYGIGWIDSDFHPHFPDADFEPRALGTFQKLSRNMTDAEIESELKPGICELGDVLAFLENPPEGTKDGYANLFYTPSSVVVIYWYADGRFWRVRTWKRNDYEWDAGKRVFSPATKTLTLVSSESSGTLTLKPAKKKKETMLQVMTRVADALEIIANKN